MANLQTFRGAINGFNREDVVRYIEYITNRHNDEVSRLHTELDELRAQLAAAQVVPAANEELEQRLEASESRCAALEEELAAANTLLQEAMESQQTAQKRTGDELEAYRRAERTERVARERAELLYAQANGALADATAVVDEAAVRLSAMANDVAAQMNAFRDAVLGTKTALTDAAASMYAVRPCVEETQD